MTTLQLAGWSGVIYDVIISMETDFYGTGTVCLALPCWGVSALYGFIRPIFYKPSDLVAYGSYNEGFSFQFVPFEDNLGIKLSYRKTF